MALKSVPTALVTLSGSARLSYMQLSWSMQTSGFSSTLIRTLGSRRSGSLQAYSATSSASGSRVCSLGPQVCTKSLDRPWVTQEPISWSCSLLGNSWPWILSSPDGQTTSRKKDFSSCNKKAQKTLLNLRVFLQARKLHILTNRKVYSKLRPGASNLPTDSHKILLTN